MSVIDRFWHGLFDFGGGLVDFFVLNELFANAGMFELLCKWE